MRVVFLAHSYPRRDGDLAGSFLLRLAQALRPAGVEVLVVAPSAAGLEARAAVGDVPVVRYRYAPRALETLAYTGTMADAVRGSWPARAALGGLLAASAAATRRAARSWRADVVHAHWWFPGGAAAAAAVARAGRPLVVTLHGSDVRLARAIAPARAAFAAVAARAAALTAVSSYLCEQARAMAPSVACAVAPMPVDDRLFSPPAAGTERSGVLFVGRLTRQKGVDRLLRAVAAHVPGTLTVCGDGPEAPALRTLAAQLGIDGRVTWLPPRAQSELAALYQRAAVLAVPSREEGLGLVAVEAALCETPTVAFRSGGLTDVVADGGGALVPLDDVDAFGRALAGFVNDPGQARSAGRVARHFVAERFAMSAVAARYRDVYAACTGRGAAAAAR